MAMKIIKRRHGRPNLDQTILSLLYSMWRSEERLKKMLKMKNFPNVIIVNEIRIGIKRTQDLDDAKKALFKKRLL